MKNMGALTVLFLLFSISTQTNGLSTELDLVHRDSPLSPLYNSSSTLSELARNVMLRSQIRSRRRHLLQTDLLAPFFVQEEGEYLMRIYVGSPPVERWAIADTGSDLIWIQCLPCDPCFSQDSPIFNPLKSSTYHMVSCHSKPCTLLHEGSYQCGNSTQCEYIYGYGDGDASDGDLATDFFSFSAKHASFNKSSLVFGCSHQITGEFPSKASGFVGLGAGPLSLVSQLGSEIGYKFSYCLVPYFSNSSSKLKLGDEAKTSHGAVSTPLIIHREGYFLTLEGVTVGNKTVATDPNRERNTGIDSGATWFYMEPSFYKKVEALIKDSIGVKEVKKASHVFKLCYSNKDAETVINKFPDFVVHFKGGADLHLKPNHNLLFPQDDFICLAIIPVDYRSVDEPWFIYGSVPQVNFQVEHDLEAKLISFAPTDCSNY